MKRISRPAGRFVLNGVAAAALTLAAHQALALGLGRLTVQSALGESLRAEIDVTSLTPEEASSFRARVAPPDAYRAAGVEYNPVLPGTEVSLQRRSDGRPYLRITSDRVVQEPFLDVILELSWASGRLVREYTLLIDPPSSRQAAAASTGAQASGMAPAPAPSPSRAAAAPSPSVSAPAPTPARRPAPAAPRQETAAAPTPAPAPAGTGADEYRVRRGDTLYSIANRVQRPGVSLDQMLVALYRANPEAFLGENMNRLKAGVVLQVPAGEQAQAVSPSEARQLIQAQSADFAAYRQRLASAAVAAAGAEPSRQASGQLQAEVQDRKQAAAPSADKLTLSKGGVAAKGGAEESIAKQREKQEASARVAELSRNLQELQKLSPAASAPAAAPAPAPAAAPPAAPVAPSVAAASVPGVAVPVAAATAPAASAAVAQAAASEASAPAAAASAVAAAASAPARAAAASKPTLPQPPVVEEPSFIDGLLENPLALPLAGGLIVLLAGLGLYRLKAKTKQDSGETSFLESRLQPDTFFGASGGQRIDTKDASGTPSSLSYSLSQLDAIGDVDPVAEADVYLAYGRDLQAEEILKEAMRANPERLAIRTKLLEVYAKRRDSKGFEVLATQLYGLTGGEGEEWQRAQELGRQIDPENALYRPGGQPAEARVAEGPAEPLGASTMPQSVMPEPQPGRAPAAAAAPPGGGIDLDLDLSLTEPAVAKPVDSETTQPLSAAPSLAELPSIELEPVGVAKVDEPLAFELPDLEPPAPEASQGATASDSRSMDFDLSDLTLDLGPAPASAGAPEVGVAEALPDLDLGTAEPAGGDPLARKLELAEEFRQIGDREGARELLQEVVAKSSGALKAKAQNMLAELA
ncbi:FimV/HubP family polar landmark protein [Schlegelella aquatica]|uniref:FimV/HubP family polar landmark protein n=1 Tax=Caldimonas aquatica TaxID=376175 RepID=UPI003752A8D2